MQPQNPNMNLKMLELIEGKGNPRTEKLKRLWLGPWEGPIDPTSITITT